MARRVRAFPATAPKRRGHPWDEWLDGKIWELVRGDDFEGLTANFLSLAWKRADQRGKGLRTHRSPDGKTVYIQAVPRV